MKKNFQFVDFPIPPRRNHFRLIIISEIIIVVSYGLMGGRRRGIYSLRMDSGLMGNAWYQGTQKIFIICPVRAVSRNCERPSFLPSRFSKKRREYIISMGHRSCCGMELWKFMYQEIVNSRCWPRLSTSVSFSYISCGNIISLSISLSLSLKKKKMVFSNLILNFYTRLDNG